MHDKEHLKRSVSSKISTASVQLCTSYTQRLACDFLTALTFLVYQTEVIKLLGIIIVCCKRALPLYGLTIRDSQPTFILPNKPILNAHVSRSKKVKRMGPILSCSSHSFCTVGIRISFVSRSCEREKCAMPPHSTKWSCT